MARSFVEFVDEPLIDWSLALVNASSPVPASRRRGPQLLIMGGCAIAGVCLLLGCAAIAGFSLLSFPLPGAEPPPSDDEIRTELAALPPGSFVLAPRYQNTAMTNRGVLPD